MRTLSAIALVFASFLLLACGPTDATSVAGGNQALTSGASGGQTSNATSPVAIELPEFQYPEELAVELDRVIHVRNSSGELERREENFMADGQGNYLLDITGFSPNQVQPFSAPSSLLLMNYQTQMRFMVKYRDLHLRAPSALFANFQWFEDPVQVQVAGVNCIRYTAKSTHDMGDAEFLADAQTGLLLGWTLFENNGSVSMKLETTMVNLNPNLNGVAWSAPVVGEQAFTGPNDFGALGFEPLEPEYLPPGFYQEEAWLRFSGSAPAFQGMSNMLVRIFSDGIHLVFVAQNNQNIQNPGLQVANKVSDVFETNLGGIRVAEGSIGKRRLYVASLLAMDEIETIFGSIMP